MHEEEGDGPAPPRGGARLIGVVLLGACPGRERTGAVGGADASPGEALRRRRELYPAPRRSR